MNENEIEHLEDIFYTEAVYDYVLVIEKRKRKYFYGSCNYDGKVCYIYGPENYMSALFTMLHEIAHARIRHTTHSDVWEKEFVRLLHKYKFPKNVNTIGSHIMGPNVKEYFGVNA